jgi:hypothetical protein
MTPYTSFKTAGDLEKMSKKAPLFKFESFTTRKVKCAEASDLPRKHDR